MIPGIDDLSAREALLAVEHARHRELSAQADTMALAAHWCDLHGEVTYDHEGRVRVGDEELVTIGGDGTPQVEEFAAAEFGAMRHQNPGAARNLLADALDLRHRLPHLWAAVHALKVEVWLARKIASMTRALDREAVALVDAAIADQLESLPVARLLDLVEAEIIRADPEAAEERRKAAEAARYVRTSKDGEGMMMLIARASAGDVVVLAALIDRIAEILAERGDDEPLDVRRSKALGILAHPDQALRLLLEAAHRAGVPDHVAEAEMTGETHPDTEPQPEPANPGDGHADDTAGGRVPLRELLATSPATKALRPRATLFVHLSDAALTSTGVARVEGLGAVVLDQVRGWLGHAQVTLTPVLDLPGLRPVDAYETPRKIREALHQVSPADAFPWADNRTRRKDADHCTAYVPPRTGGPPGQTGLHNLAPLVRHHHRIKTFTDWKVTCLSPGRYHWRSPHGFHFLVDQDGTHRLPDRLKDALKPVSHPEHSTAEDHLVKMLLRTLPPTAA